MYYHNRATAGRMIASKLKNYASQNIAVVAIDRGGVIVGAQIAMELHANLMLLMMENIKLLGEKDAIGEISSSGNFVYNNMFTSGELDEIVSEYHGIIDTEKLKKLHQLNLLVGRDGEVKKDYLRHHVVVLVSDGLSGRAELDLAYDFFKSIKLKRLIVATPIASVDAVDRMHLLGDEIVCLSVTANYIETNHYYSDNTIPSTKSLFKIVRNISLNWHNQ